MKNLPFLIFLAVDFLIMTAVMCATPIELQLYAFILVTAVHVCGALIYMIRSTLQVRRRYAEQAELIRKQQAELIRKQQMDMLRQMSAKAHRRQSGFVTWEFVGLLTLAGVLLLAFSALREYFTNAPLWQTILGLWAGSTMLLIGIGTGVVLGVSQLIGGV